MLIESSPLLVETVLITTTESCSQKMPTSAVTELLVHNFYKCTLGLNIIVVGGRGVIRFRPFGFQPQSVLLPSGLGHGSESRI